MSKSLAAGALCALLSTLPAGLAAQEAAPREQVRAELQSLCERQRDSLNPYFGDLTLRELERRLELPASDPVTRVTELGRYAYEMVRLGEHARALEVLDQALETLGEIDARGVRDYLLAMRAVALLQQAEDQNCLALHTQASCIVPLRPEGVHTEPDLARAAGDAFERALGAGIDRVDTRWLLNLSRMVSGDFPEGVPEKYRLPEDAFAPPADLPPLPRWVDVGARLGVNPLDTAGGAVVDDFDGDGMLDLVSTTWDPCGPMKAFRNDGEGGFEDVTEAWGLDVQLGGLNLVHADYDDDGMLDLLVLRGAWFGDVGRMRNSLLRNDLQRESGTFVDVTSAAGLAYPAYPTQAAAFADFDLDGDLDLAIGNEAADINADPLALDPLSGSGYPAQLFRNEGEGRFIDIARRVGLVDRGFTKGIAWGDYDDDGDPDLYLSNLGPNRLFRNDREKGFRDVTDELGVDGGQKRTFATWFFDWDDDGDLDLFVAPFSAPPRVIAAHYFGLPLPPEGDPMDTTPILFRNDGGRFVDVADEVGLDAPALVMGANFGDLDADGRLDLYLGTGMPDFSSLMPNLAYRNTGERFQDVTFAVGLGHLQKGHGVAFGDVDNDGLVELFEQLGGAFPYDAYTNALFVAPDRDARWIVLRFDGQRSNHFGIGTRLHLTVRENGRLRSIHRRVDSGGSFGGSSLQQEIALADAEAIERLEVRWPSGVVSEYRDVELDRFYEVIEGEKQLRALEVRPIELRLRPAPAHEHHDTTHDPASSPSPASQE